MNAFLQGFKVPAKLYWDASYEKILESQHYLSDLRVQNWLHNSFPKWTWWFLVFWSILPLFIWWKYIDRTRFLEISLFGLIVSISAGILDALGVAFLLWCYPYALVPALPNFFPIDYVVIPVCFMLIYQKYSGWKEFLTAVTVIAS
ncbi:MAG: CBO0543 family protein, partial [Deltaproteobacteria bacterium]